MEGLFHVWFGVKYRKGVLQGELRDDVKASLRRIARQAEIDLIETEAIFDHVHLLLRLHGTQTLAKAMHQLKGASAREILLTYPDVKSGIGHQSLWQRGYGWRKIGEDELFKVRNYIRTQQSRPFGHE